jgi:hypothetical protein
MRALLFATTLMLVVTANVNATVILYENEDFFLFNAPPLEMESFEGLTPTCVPDTDFITVDAFTMSIDSGPHLSVCDENGFAEPTDGDNFVAVIAGPAGSMMIQFDEPVAWVSFDLIDFGDWDDEGNMRLQVNNEPNDQFIVATAPLPDGAARFVGFESLSPFTTITFTVTVVGDAYGLDKVRYGSEVEEIACNADLNGDQTVDVMDLLEVLAQWGTAGSADLDASGSVGITDLLEVLAAWGPC